jgi:hypothetical protein
MPAIEELIETRNTLIQSGWSTQDRLTYLYKVMSEYLPTTMVRAWFDVFSSLKDSDQPLAEALGLFVSDLEIGGGDEHELKSIIAGRNLVYPFARQRNVPCGADLPFVDSQRGFLILYVSTFKPMRKGFFFPAYWKQGRDDRRLPTSLRMVADAVRRSLSAADQDIRYDYQSWGLRMWPTLEPKYPEPEPEHDGSTESNDPCILDALFPPTSSSASAAATLLATLYTVVREGRLQMDVLATGVGELGADGLIQRISSVDDTLLAKMELAFRYMNEIDLDVRLFVPDSDFVRANAIAAEEQNRFNKKSDTGKQLSLKWVGSVQGTEKLLDAILPLREALQAKPRVNDPLSAQEAYYTSRSNQDDRSRFHVEIMQKGALLKRLERQWDPVKAASGMTEFVTISLVSRSWEFPILDCRVIKPNAAYLLLLNDQGGSASEFDRLKEIKSEMEKSIEGNVQPKVIEIDVLKESTPDDREKILVLELQRLKTEILDSFPNAQLVFNFSSGPRNYSLKLLEETPNGAFLTVYRGQSDPVNNLPLVGSTDLILYHKNELGIVQRYQPATTSKAAVAAEE